MKLLSARVHKFRVHGHDEPVEITFDGELHVVHGENETGKSTLMDAIAAALFEKSRLTGARADAMRPRDGQAPEVRVEFELDGRVYAVTKRFNKSKGTCELIERDGDRIVQTRSGDDAEAELERILGLPENRRGERAPKQLAHWRLLWVGQGASGQGPATQINEQTENELRNLLTKETGAAMTTEAEARWIAELEKDMSERFTSRGSDKAGSPVDKLQKQIDELAGELSDEQALRERVEHDSEAAIVADEQISQLASHLPELRAQLANQRARVADCDRLAAQVRDLESQLQLALRDLSRAHGHEVEIKKIDQDRERLAAQRSEIADQLAELKGELVNGKSKQKEAVKGAKSADATCVVARRCADRAARQIERIRLRAQVDPLQRRIEQVEIHGKERDRLTGSIAKLKISEADLDDLRSKESVLSQAEAALEVASAQLDITSTESVRVVSGEETESFDQGKIVTRRIDEQTQIVIGDDTAVISVTPGGEDLQHRRNRVTESQREIEQVRQSLGVQTVADAQLQVRERQSLERKRDDCIAKVDALAPEGDETLRDELAEARGRLEAIDEELIRLSKSDDPALPKELGPAEENGQVLRDEFETAESRQVSARNELRSVEERIRSCEHRLELAAQKEQQFADRASELDGRRGDVVGLYENQGGLDAALKVFQKRCDETGASKQTVDAQFAELNPQVLASEADRLTRAVDGGAEELQRLREHKEGLLGQLRAVEAVGLNERIGKLESNLESAREHLARQRLQADAIMHLHQCVMDCREEATQAVMAPLREKVRPLLRLVFSQANIGFKIDENNRLALEPLERGDSLDEFDVLSGGTREQLGVAVRLALAQVLAEANGGTLPVFLDEPFVNTSPNRRARVLAMLNSVRSDLQLIVLTCDFADYRDLGLDASQITSLDGTS